MPHRDATDPRQGRAPTSNGGSGALGAGQILQLVREGRARTRGELISVTGLGRSTITQRVDALVARNLLRPVGDDLSTGGRPATVFAFNEEAGFVLTADLGATHCSVALADLGARIVAERYEAIDIADGPETILAWAEAQFVELMHEAHRDPSGLRAIGVGVPGPVEFATGRTMNPPLMPGWHAYPIRERLAERFGVPVLVDNDVNVMALGEHWVTWRETEDLMFVKVGTGIGCGIITGGRIVRGAQGAAGDMGHVRVSSADDAVCRCGNRGCLEAVASGAAVARELAALGRSTRHSRDVVELVTHGDAEAIQAVRRAGGVLGEVLASAVNFFNPAVIVIGGDMAHADAPMLAGVREAIYERSLPLATRDLRIERTRLNDHAGVIGLAVLVIEHMLEPATLDAALASEVPAAG